MAVIAQRRGWKMVIGGDGHVGWLPTGAAAPPSEPVRQVLLNVEIHRDASGYFLTYTASDGSMAGDTWHQTREQAEAAARKLFGLKEADWEPGETNDAG